MNVNAHWGSTADDSNENENHCVPIVPFNRKLLLFALKNNSVCRNIIRLPVHSELALT